MVYDCVRRDGSVFAAEFSVISWPSDPALSVALVKSVAERDEWIEEVSRSERLYRTIADHIPAGVMIADSSNRRTYVNRRACEITGYSEEELLAGVDLLHPDDIEGRRVREEAYEKLIPGSYHEARYLRKDGSVVWVTVSWSPFVDDRGECAGLCVVFTDITEQILARSAMRSAESVYRILAEAIPSGVLITDRTGRNIYANAQAARMTGYSVEELLAGASLLHPEDEEAHRIYARVFEQWPSGAGYETRLVRKDGSTIWVLVAWQVITGDKGEPEGICSVFTDITERKAAELACRTAESSYTSLAEAAGDIVWQMDLEGKFTYVSQSVAHYGYTHDDWLGHSIAEFLPEHERSRFLKRFAEDVANPGSRRHEVEMLRRDGSTAWMDVSIDYVIEDGIPTRLIGLARDITQRKRAEFAHRESEERFETLVRNVPGAVYRCAVDEHWTMEFISEGIRDISGYPAADFVDNRVRSYASIIHPDDTESVAEVVARGVATGESYTIEYRIVHSDGGTRWVFERGRAIRDAAGCVRCLDGVILDATGTKRVQEDLEASEDRYRSIVENASELIMLTRADGVITYMSPRCRQITGYEPEEIVGRQVNLAPPEDLPAAMERFKGALSGEPGRDAQSRIVTKSGEIRWISHSWSPIFRDGKLHTVVSVVSDITELKRIEEIRRIAHENLERALELQKQFLHGVTHEVRTPLTSIVGYAKMLLEGASGNLTDENKQMLRSILASSENLLDTVEGVLEIARLKSGTVALNPLACKPCEVVRAAVTAVEPEARRKGIAVDLECPDVCAMGVYDTGKLAIVLGNLLSNAVKFTTRGGVKVIVECPDEGPYVVVADTGIGISRSNLSLVFDEFAQFDDLQRQKPQGFGLGLAVVASLVEVMGGGIAVSSARGLGTAFTLFVPQIDELSADRQPDSPGVPALS